MRHVTGALAIAVLLGGTTGVFAQSTKEAAEEARRLQRARDVIQTFSEQLRHELTVAIRSKGAAAAIEACQILSPDLAGQVSSDAGVEILRTSLKVRNPENAPDEWEEQILKRFQAEAATGADLAKLEHHEVVVTAEGDKLLRYMKAIPVTDMCLTCHGTDVKQDVKAEIARLYPEDKALGYKIGELRGAFSLIQVIEE